MKQETRDPQNLTHHPLIKNAPMLAEDHPDCKAIAESLSQDGFTQPVVINERDEIMDGRHRVRAAIAMGMTSVPVIVRPDSDAAGVIVHSLVARRHHSKWQIAYFLADMYHVKTDDGIKARSQNLRRGNQPGPRERSNWAFGEIIENLGISAETWQRVQRVRNALLADPKLREKYEPLLFAHGPSAMSLEGVARALPSCKTYEEKDVDLPAMRREYDRHVNVHLGKLSGIFTKNWSAMSPKMRADIEGHVVGAISEWPDDLKTRVIEQLGHELGFARRHR